MADRNEPNLAVCLHQSLPELLSNEQMMAPLLPIFHHYKIEKSTLERVHNETLSRRKALQHSQC
jgi:hypothetical protein